MEMRTDIKPPLDDDVRYGINDYRTTLYEMIAPEIRSSARHKEAASQVATPTSASDMITTRPMRSISKSKQTGSNLSDASSVCTKAWVEDLRKQQQQHRDKRVPQSSENNQQQQPQQQSQQQPQQPQPQQSQQQPHQATRPGSCFNAEAGSGALRRELAAVVATAPRTVSGGIWQSTVVATQPPKLQPSPGQQQQQQQQQRRWSEPVPVPGPLPMPVTAPEVDTTAGTTQLRTRVRKLRKDCKERRQTKPKEEQQQQQQQQQMKQQPRAKQEVKAQLQEQRLISDHKTVDLALAIERLKIEHHELQQKRHKILEQEEKEKEKKKQSRKGHRKHSTDGDTYYTPKESVQEEPKVLHGSAAFVCYKSRLSRMEEDMAKCKQQLFHYVQDNEQLLHEQSVRHHVEQLLHSTSSASTTSSPLAGMANTTNELTLQATLKRDQNQLNLGHLKLERDRQKQLQLREFLARDDTNANAYELPNLSNVYKVSSRHAQLLPTTATSAVTQSQSSPLPNSKVNDALKTFVDRVDSTLINSRAQRNRQPIVATNNIYSCYFPENKSEVSVHNRVQQQQQQQQSYERIRIQEANFYKDFEMANFDESAHICRK
ncbi:hypothetical protein KR215_006632 [Drosophila sulfurigaster]|nr:hypothetical protein KR215_006632 [Drosophila sulfurigaster]